MKLNKNDLAFAISALLAIFIVILHFLFHPVRVLGMSTSIFYMDEKVTLAAFYTTVVTFVVGFLTLYNLDHFKKRFEKFLYFVFGVFFIYLAFDEYFEVHEYANELVKTHFTENTVGQLAQLSWIYPLFILIMAVFLVFSLILVMEKSIKSKIFVLLGMLSYFFVIVFEFLGASTFGQDIYVTYVGVEEGLEMLGSAFFLAFVLHKFTDANA
jgi:hypothetical protein